MSPAGDKSERRSDALSAVALFALHTYVAMVLGSLLMVIAAVIADPFLKDAAPWLKSVVQWGGLLNPFAWIPGIALGLTVNRILDTRRRVVCWVWIVGVVWLTAGIWDSVRHYDARYSQGCSVLQNVANAFFILDSQRCGDAGPTLAGLFFTIPAINSIGYAVGAWLAQRLRKELSKQA